MAPRTTVLPTLAALLNLTFAAAISQEQPSVQVAFAGDFIEPRGLPASGADWFAVTRTASGLALTRTCIEVSTVPDPCGGSATRVAAVGAKAPLFLVRGLTSLREGSLKSSFDGRRFVHPAEDISLKLEVSGKYYGFASFGSATPGETGTRHADYRIRLSRGRIEQMIAEIPFVSLDNPPTMAWAGDLDRDDSLDAPFNLPTSHASDHYVLFLSSMAATLRLVEKAAEFHITGFQDRLPHGVASQIVAAVGDA
jgi:hypothetical protein